MATETYATVKSTIEALIGATLGTTESTRLQHLINRRAKKAYDASDYWQDFLVVGEERFVHGDNLIKFTDPGVNDPFTASHSPIDTLMRVHKDEPWVTNSSDEYLFDVTSDGARLKGYTKNYVEQSLDHSFGASMVNSNPGLLAGLLILEVSDGPGTAYDTDVPWLVGDTFKIANTVANGGDPDINREWVITTISPDYPTASKFTVTARPDPRDTSLTAGSVYTTTSADLLYPLVYVTYKKVLDVTYGENDTTTVPQVWAQYLIHGAYADFLRADGQTEKAIAEEGFASEALDSELMKIDRHGITPGTSTLVSTHGTRQHR